jgi:uncharacterized protein
MPQPPPPTDRHGLEVLNLPQCLALLRSRPVGRISYIDGGQPIVVPVNHVVDGASVVIRSLSGGKLDSAVLGEPVAFELDDHDVARATGWSVLVRGRAALVDDPADIERLDSELDSWALAHDSDGTWIRIIADEISGRRIVIGR